MAIGIACGSFNFVIAILATLVIMVVLTVFTKVEAKISNKKMILMVTAPTDKPVLANVLEIAKEFDCTIKTLSTDLIAKEGTNLIQFTLEVVFNSKEGKSTEFITKLSKETDAVDIYTLTNHR